MNGATQSTLAEHLRELRGRLLISVGVFLLGAVVGYVFRSQVMEFLQKPLNQPLYYTTPTGSFEFVMQVSGVVGLIVALPVLIFHLLRFVEPALPHRLRPGLLVGVMLLSLGLAIVGAAVAYYLSLPVALNFFRSVGTNHLHALISVDRYCGFVFAYLTTFAVVFQLPLILFLINHITPFGPGGLRKWRKFIIIGAFAVAIITPSAPDPLSQVILALPIILLYEISLAAIWMRERSRHRVTAKAPGAYAAPVPTRMASFKRPSKPMPIVDLRSFDLPRRLPNSNPGNVLDLRGH